MTPDYGTDLLLLDGFGPSLPTASGVRLVAAALYRRWTTDQASVPGRNIYKGQCRDLKALLGAQLQPARLVGLAREYAQVAREDERVADVVCLFEAALEGRKLGFRAQVATKASGPFALVIPFDSFLPEVILGAA
mgnify:CR=1 FL=1